MHFLNMALIDKASLLMVPSTYEAGTLYNVLPSGNRAPDSTDQNSGYDQTRADFTFDRGSNAAATRVNADGLIEKYRENLLTESNNFSDSDWANDDTTETSGFEGYDGTNNAWKLVGNTNASRHYILQSISKSGVNTWSLYAKASGHSYVQFGSGSTVQQYVNFDLSDGSVGNIGSDFFSAIAEDVGNGWYRLSVVDKGSTNGFYISLVSSKTAGWLESWTMDNATDGILIQNAQLETGLVATDYLDSGATTAKAGVLIDLPRINYDANGENGALLLEPQRANTIQYSEYTDGSNWSNEGSIIDEENTSETTSPEGLYNAVKLVSANATSEQWIQTTGVQTTNATDCTISCFVKKSDYDYFHIRFTGINGAFSAGSVWFNIAEGSVGTKQTGITADIKDYGNGWYRIFATKEATATTTAGIRFQLASGNNDYNVVGDGVKGTYIYGCQAESGSYATSYIPNMGESGGVTRAADSCSVTGVSDVIGQTEGTMYIEGSIDSWDTNGIMPIVLGDSTSNQIYVWIRSPFRATSVMQSNGTSQSNLNTSSDYFDFGDTFKIAILYAEDYHAMYVNGNLIATDTDCSLPTSMGTIRIGQYFSNGYTGGAYNKAMIFKTRLSNEEAIALTTL